MDLAIEELVTLRDWLVAFAAGLSAELVAMEQLGELRTDMPMTDVERFVAQEVLA